MFHETKLDAVMAAKKAARENSLGYAFAAQWSMNRWSVETRKPMLRPPINGRTAELIECRKDGSELLA